MAAGYGDVVFVSRSGRPLALAVALVAVLAVVGAALRPDVAGRIVAAVAAVVVIALAYRLLWRPRLVIGDRTLRIVGPWRTRDLPWSAVTGASVGWVLVVEAGSHRYPVWAVPRPSAADFVGQRYDGRGLPDYEAEQQHLDQDRRSGPAAAALAVILDRIARTPHP